MRAITKYPQEIEILNSKEGTGAPKILVIKEHFDLVHDIVFNEQRIKIKSFS